MNSRSFILLYIVGACVMLVDFLMILTVFEQHYASRAMPVVYGVYVINVLVFWTIFAIFYMYFRNHPTEKSDEKEKNE